jgi:hypothetical protein
MIVRTHRRSAGARLLILAAISLAVGFATSVGVSWSLALWPEQTFTFTHGIEVNTAPVGSRAYSDRLTFIDEYRPGFRRVTAGNTPLSRVVVDRIADKLASVDHTPLDPWNIDVQRPQRPLWFVWLPRSADDGQILDETSARAAGWPWLCLCSTRVRSGGNPAAHIRGALPIVPPSSYRTRIRTDPDLGTVPLLPIWSGLAADTGVFALPWLVILGVPSLRRALRVRRGLCPHCGYDLRGLPAGSPCPECGRPASTRYHRTP